MWPYKKVSNVQWQFFVYELRLFTSETYPKFVILDQFLRDLQPKQIFRQTDKL